MNETRRWAALLDQDFIAGQGLGLRILTTIRPEQHPSQLDMRDGEVYIVRRERFFIAADHVAKKLFGARVVLLVIGDARHVGERDRDKIVVIAVDSALDVSRTLESRLRVVQLVAHRSHVPQFVESFSHRRMYRTINTFLDG